ncbi:hypothetical protein HYN48_02325 [Flavobacterium magnum]|uniref:Lipocalin-like domain-containing protein n=1 Tax=Flavobacterium magnum TaxID=2162713 RepID=A0A2S0RAH2_9FLAO|nr:hypothetical protein [Flavobacterium magnum]AWA29017.1 hypothetical protein HYN48_02325 [Flavobacterium magnum]
MKKLMISLLAIGALFVSSCNDDGKNPSSNGIVQLTVNGQKKSFSIESHSVDNGGEKWITFGGISGIENIVLNINEGDSSLESISYTFGGQVYTALEGQFTSNATVSTNGHVTGTFSGKLTANAENQVNLIVSAGMFEITYD